MMHDSITLALFVTCLFAVLLTWNHDRRLEPVEAADTDNDD